MKVKFLIEQLQAHYDMEDELAVAYWDRETVDSYVDGDQEITEELWYELVQEFENGEWSWQSWAADSFVDSYMELTFELGQFKKS